MSLKSACIRQEKVSTNSLVTCNQHGDAYFHDKSCILLDNRDNFSIATFTISTWQVTTTNFRYNCSPFILVFLKYIYTCRCLKLLTLMGNVPSQVCRIQNNAETVKFVLSPSIIFPGLCDAIIVKFLLSPPPPQESRENQIFLPFISISILFIGLEDLKVLLTPRVRGVQNNSFISIGRFLFCGQKTTLVDAG